MNNKNIRIKEIINNLKEILKEDDLKNVQEILNNFVQALEFNDIKSINLLKEQIFDLEKNYIPQIPENKTISEKLKSNVLISTVGFQPEPVILTILILKPSIVYLLHSNDSLSFAEKIINDKDIKISNIEFKFKEIFEYNSVENYKIIKNILDEISKDKKIAIDLTGGGKMMVSSISLAAFYFHLPMVYLQSMKIGGLVIPFSEKLKLIENPFDYFGDVDLKLVEEFFNSHFYDAAIKTCKNMENYIKDLATLKKIELLKELISVYREWDAFMHSKYCENFKREKPLLSERLKLIVNKFKKLNLVNCLPENIENNIIFLENLDKSFKNSLNIVDEYRIVDIYLCALRKGTEKQAKYDDGIARLYRCIEMCFTYKLKSLGLNDVSNPDYLELCKKLNINLNDLKNKFKEFSKKELIPGEPLALDNQVYLLKSINQDDKMVKIYEDIKEEIKMRNRSILAHGTRPSTEEDWEKFKKKTIQIIKFTIGEKRFKELAGEKTGLGWHGKINLK